MMTPRQCFTLHLAMHGAWTIQMAVDITFVGVKSSSPVFLHPTM